MSCECVNPVYFSLPTIQQLSKFETSRSLNRQLSVMVHHNLEYIKISKNMAIFKNISLALSENVHCRALACSWKVRWVGKVAGPTPPCRWSHVLGPRPCGLCVPWWGNHRDYGSHRHHYPWLGCDDPRDRFVHRTDRLVVADFRSSHPSPRFRTPA